MADQVDGLDFFRRRHQSGDSNGADSAYNTDEEGGSSMGKANRRSSKKPKSGSKTKYTTIPALVESVHGLNVLNELVDNTNEDGFRRSSGSSSDSGHSEEVMENVPSIDDQPVKLSAGSSTKCDCDRLLQTGNPIGTLEETQTQHPVLEVKFAGCDGGMNTVQKWMNYGEGTKYDNLQFWMTSYSNEDDNDSGEKEETPDKPPSEEEEEEVEGGIEVADGGTEDKYNYRLARMKEEDNTRIVAVHVDDAEMMSTKFEIGWKLEKEDDGFFTLQDTDKDQGKENLYLAVNSTTVPSMVKIGDYSNYFVNPQTRLSIWPATD